MCESRSCPTRIASKDTSNSFFFFRAQARSLHWPKTHRKEKGKAPGGEENICLYKSEEVRGQVPGTTCNGAYSKSRNIQTPADVMAPEGVAQCLGLQRHQAEVPATQYGASRWRHMFFIIY